MGGIYSKVETGRRAESSSTAITVHAGGQGETTLTTTTSSVVTTSVSNPSASLARRFSVSSMSSREAVEEHVRHECEELLSRGTVDETEGWEKVFQDGERLRVWRRKAGPKSTAFEYALRGKTVHPPHVFFKTAFLDVDNRMHWDESCGDARFLERCDKSGVETLYWVTKYPWPVSERDYVYHRLMSKRQGDYHAVSWVGNPPSTLAIADFTKPSQSTLDQVPNHRIRVVDYRTAMLVRPTPEGGAIWCLRVLDDPKVAMVPTSVVNWIVSKTLPSSANKLDLACSRSLKT